MWFLINLFLEIFVTTAFSNECHATLTINLDHKQRQFRGGYRHGCYSTWLCWQLQSWNEKSLLPQKAKCSFTNMQQTNFPLAPLIESNGKFQIYVRKQLYNFENWKCLDSGKTLQVSKGPIKSCLRRISETLMADFKYQNLMYLNYLEIKKYLSLLLQIFNP